MVVALALGQRRGQRREVQNIPLRLPLSSDPICPRQETGGEGAKTRSTKRTPPPYASPPFGSPRALRAGAGANARRTKQPPSVCRLSPVWFELWRAGGGATSSTDLTLSTFRFLPCFWRRRMRVEAGADRSSTGRTPVHLPLASPLVCAPARRRGRRQTQVVNNISRRRPPASAWVCRLA